MFATLFYNVLNSYGCLEKLYTITADNSTVNNKIAWELSLQIRQFDTPTKLLGCIVHVINLSAKAGISSLGKMEDEEDREDKELSTVNLGTSHPDVAPPPPHQMAISFVTSDPHGAKIDSNSILKKIHGLCTYIRFLSVANNS
jgi:hypothetical protein